MEEPDTGNGIKSNMKPSVPLRPYFLSVGSVLLAALLAVAEYLEPQSQDTDFGISSAEASSIRAERSVEVSIFDKLRALPLRK
jgi:hypothetical protein